MRTCRVAAGIILLICFILAGGLAVAQSGSNLLINGDFEAGFTAHPAGLVANGWTPFVLPPGASPIFGQGSGRTGSGQTLQSGTAYRAGIYQVVAGLTPGTFYRAGFSALLPDAGIPITPLVGISPLGDTDPITGLIAWSNARTRQGEWTQMTITFTTNSDIATVFLRMDQGDAGTPITVVLDDAYVRPASSSSRPLLPLIIHNYPLPTPTPSPTATRTPSPSPTPTATPPATSTPSGGGPIPYWDPRLTQLNVTVEQNPLARYQLIAAFITVNGSWDDVPDWARAYDVPSFPERGGDHHVFGRCLDAQGNVLYQKGFVLSWPDGAAGATPEASGWANLPIYGGAYYPDQGQSGPYRWATLNGNQLRGIGMPYNHHVSFFAVWQEQPAGTPTPPPSPTATATPPAVSPTPTPTASAGWRFAAEGIIVGYPDCGRTILEGTIRDAAGSPLAGQRVKVWAPQWGEAISAPSDSSGHWEVWIAHAPLAATWQAVVVDSAGNLISPIAGQMHVPQLGGETAGIPTSTDCVNGHQRLVINWRERQDWPDFAAASARFLSCQENHGNHNLYIWVLDHEGRGLNNIYLRLSLPSGAYMDERTGKDPYKPAGYLDFPMFAGESRTVRLRDYSSDLVTDLSNTTPPVIDSCGGNSWGHYSYHVVFQASKPLSALRFLRLPLRPFREGP
ncbi:MAG: hypothetical protein ACUVT1_13120 [Anaerolineae bacterium]